MTMIKNICFHLSVVVFRRANCIFGAINSKGKETSYPNFYLYIYTPGKINGIKLLLKTRQLARYCYFKPLHFNGVLNVFKQSYATIDHPMTIQTGLTIRTFEAIASGYTCTQRIVILLKKNFTQMKELQLLRMI